MRNGGGTLAGVGLVTAAFACCASAFGPGNKTGAMVVDCYLRTAIEPAECGKDLRFDLYQRLPNNAWSAPVTGVNCDGKGGHSVRGAPEPFGLGIPLASCESACEAFPNGTANSGNCTGIIVSKPYNSSCEPARVQSCPDKHPDLCAGAPTRCSPEICDLEPGQVSRLKPGTYYHDKQIFLPTGSAIIGAGINVTHIVACGSVRWSGKATAERVAVACLACPACLECLGLGHTRAEAPTCV